MSSDQNPQRASARVLSAVSHLAENGTLRRDRRGLGVAVVLIVLLSALGGTARAIWPFDQLFERPPLMGRAAELLAEAIRTPTVNPPGNERALARRLAETLTRAGIENRVIPTPSPNGGPERAAVWARLRATTHAMSTNSSKQQKSNDDSNEKAGSAATVTARQIRPGLALLSHLDTVPADASEWSVDPYSGEIWDGFVWGRGALDSKGITISHLMTLIEIAESGIELERDLIFLATPEEETGGKLGAGWIVTNHPELLEGVGYLLTEGGGIQLPRERDANRPPIWGVVLTEKSPCWLELTSRGRGGHSSAPTLDAAVPRLVAALDRIRRAESAVRVSDEVAAMFRILAPISADWDRAGFEDLPVALKGDEAFRRRFLGNPVQNALVRNTVSITVLEGASTTNVAPSVARAQLDARLLPGEECERFAEALVDLIDDTSIEISELLSFPSRASSSQTPLFRAIEDLASRQRSPGLVVPRMIGGFTDAHWFRELGIVAYGFVPRPLMPDEARRVHGVDERVSIETLEESIRLTIDLVRTFDAIESGESVDSVE